MGAQQPIEQEQKQQQQGEVFGGAIAAGIEAAVRMLREGLPAAGDNKVIPAAGAVGVTEVNLNNMPNGGKTTLASGAVLQRWNGETTLGSAKFSINPQVGWHMQFAKTGKLVASEGVKQISDANGIQVYRTADGHKVTVDKHGPLKVSDGHNITVFARGNDNVNAALPNVELNDKPKPLGLKAGPETYMTQVNENGVQSITSADGTQFHQFPDGTAAISTADGHRTKVSPNGMLTLTNPDGTIKQYDVSKAQKVMYKDGGSVGYYFPDGTVVVRKHQLTGQPGVWDTGIAITTSSGARIETFSTIPGRVDYTPALKWKQVIKK